MNCSHTCHTYKRFPPVWIVCAFSESLSLPTRSHVDHNHKWLIPSCFDCLVNFDFLFCSHWSQLYFVTSCFDGLWILSRCFGIAIIALPGGDWGPSRRGPNCLEPWGRTCNAPPWPKDGAAYHPVITNESLTCCKVLNVFLELSCVSGLSEKHARISKLLFLEHSNMS